ncbi:MAG: VTT domain-containing protein [Tepidanaerobacteraceae bacterium]|jgi:membrane protein DedA with SNARE-associated domain|nr:VTT domain-containing protein [Tepidanaerobacteraceae bacterium]
MTHLWKYSHDIITKYGYFGLYASLLAEGTGLPLPVEFLFMVVVYFIKTDKMSLWQVIIVSAAGNLSGNILAYVIGYIGGPTVINRLNRYLRIDDREIAMMKEWFGKYGGLTNMISRWIGITRTPAIWTAGIFRINFLSYSLFSLLGDFIWVLFWIMTYLELYSQFHKYIYSAWEYKLIAFIIAAAFIVAAWKIFFKLIRRGET